VASGTDYIGEDLRSGPFISPREPPMTSHPAPTAIDPARSRAEALRRSLLESPVVPEDAAMLQGRAGLWYHGR
jgi:hypothetical protein